MSKSLGIQKVLVIGSGPIVIGQGAEFDYSGSQCCLALMEEDVEIILINNNPATIMTDERDNQKVYCEPLTVPSIVKIIEIEKPDSLIVNMGGQTSLNLALQLHELGLIQKYNITILGTPIEKIKQGEDRELFRALMKEINEPVIDSEIIDSINKVPSYMEKADYPVIVRPAYTLGGRGGGVAYDAKQLEKLLVEGITTSPIHQVICEKSLLGYKEIEFEIIRDYTGHCICVCDMENMDPVGVHTGDSIVFAPSQTVDSALLAKLKAISFKIVDALNIIGGCNIQFAVHPTTDEYYLIEVNPRVSRSSALASKATGYPIARIATKLALGYSLKELDEAFDKPYKSALEPRINYIVGKFPVWPFEKLNYQDTQLTTKMKATGEIMVIDHSLEGLYGKIISSQYPNMTFENLTTSELLTRISQPTHVRFFEIMELLSRGIDAEKIATITAIPSLFIERLNIIVQNIVSLKAEPTNCEALHNLKKYQLSIEKISQLTGVGKALFTQVDTKKSFHYIKSLNENSINIPNYIYSSFEEFSEITPIENEKKVAIIGSSSIRIGQGLEFDYCTVKAIQRLKQLGYSTIIINDNPETVSTDYEIADRLYFEPITLESVKDILEFEQITECIVQFGGQTALNIGLQLQQHGFHLIGLSSDAIETFEDRDKFYQFLDENEIIHPKGITVSTSEQLESAAMEIGFPMIVRPSFVIGGIGMEVINSLAQFNAWKQTLKEKNFPLLVDSFINGMEVEVDLLSDGKDIYIPGVIEHIEKAGVHSGDSTSLFPSVSISFEHKMEIQHIAEKIAKNSSWIGLMNIQFIIAEDTIYCIEVNPRASRTIPIISKIMNVPLMDMTMDILIMGTHLSSFDILPLERFGLKVPYFSYHSLTELNHLLTPNMKSTGEALIIGDSLEEVKEKLLHRMEQEIIYNGEENEQAHKERLLAWMNNHLVITNDQAYEFYKGATYSDHTEPKVLNGQMKKQKLMI